MRKKQSPSGRGCLFLIVGTLLVMLSMALYIFSVGRITASVIESRTGTAPAYAVLTAQIPCILVAFVLLEGILILQYLPSQEEMAQKSPLGRTAEDKPRLLGTRRSTNIASVLLLLLVVVCGAVSVNTYRVISEEGIDTRIFGIGSRYAWTDVTDYTVDCDNDKGLSLTFTMSDGEQFEILQNTISDNAAFAEKYAAGGDGDKQTAMLAFALDICRSLEERGISGHVSGRGRDRAINFYKKDRSEQWVYVRELVQYQEVRPSDDETLPETESETQPATGPSA